MSNYLFVHNVFKSYDRGKVAALQGATLGIEKGEFIAIMGPSGCGKSTFLHILGTLDHPDQGEVGYMGKNIFTHPDLAAFRARKIGFVFQLHNLLPALTARENVEIPMYGVVRGGRARTARARELLSRVGLSARERHRPPELSGGERQRVAIARALANHPEILIADEPTGSLDSKNAESLLYLLRDIHEKEGSTIIMVTHDPNVATYADRTVHMLDGRFVE